MSYTQYDMNNSKRSFNYSLFESYLVSENDYSDINLSEDEFTKYNTYANFFEVIKYENPQIFERLNSGNWLTCIVAMIVWVASLIGFVLGCITIFLCALAAFAFGAATVEVVLECVPDTP